MFWKRWLKARPSRKSSRSPQLQVERLDERVTPSGFDPFTFPLYKVHSATAILGKDGHYSSFSESGYSPRYHASGVLSYVSIPVGFGQTQYLYTFYATISGQGSYVTKQLTSVPYWNLSSFNPISALLGNNPDYRASFALA